MYKNPSAGKFDPPPAPPTPGEARARLWSRVAAILLIAVTVAQRFFPPGAGRRAVFLGALAFGAHALRHALKLYEPPSNSDKGPYSEQTRVTR